MNDEAKRIIRELKNYARQYADGSTLGRAIVDTELVMTDAANMIKQLKSDRDAWKRRAEAAERDITSMLESFDCEIRHEYCARCYPPNQCNTDECAGYAKWRGPCAENGGESNKSLCKSMRWRY